MIRPQRAPVNLSDRHKEAYIRLVEEEGESIRGATRIVARKYHLTPAHTPQAVHKMLHSPKTEPLRLKIKVAVARAIAEGDGHMEFPLDEGINLMIKAFTALKKLPGVEAERDRYKRACEEAYKLRGSILGVDSNLTYHI